jgi:hypothetical protein
MVCAPAEALLGELLAQPHDELGYLRRRRRR